MNIPDWVAPYIGIPFEDYGRTRNGADCWGLARMIWWEMCGIDLPAHGDVSPNDGGACWRRMNANMGNWVEIQPGNEQRLDGVLMLGCYGDGRDIQRAPMHIGVVVEPGLLIHTDKRLVFSCIERYRDSGFGHPIVGFWRHEKCLMT